MRFITTNIFGCQPYRGLCQDTYWWHQGNRRVDFTRRELQRFSDKFRDVPNNDLALGIKDLDGIL